MTVVGLLLLVWGLVSAVQRPDMPVAVIVGVLGALLLAAGLRSRVRD